MKLYEHYQRYATDCVRHAELAQDEWSRLFLIELAQQWTNLAETIRAKNEELPAYPAGSNLNRMQRSPGVAKLIGVAPRTAPIR